jgi:hypothetical protein
MAISTKDKEKIFKQFKNLIGSPIRSAVITDDMLDSCLELAISDYSQYVQEWLVENNWQSVFGKNIDTTDFAFALSTRSLDFTTQSTYAYSKKVGLQTNGPWELKKDFIDIEAGRQVYQIPAGREVNEVLWVTPSSIDSAIHSNYGGLDIGFGGGFGPVSTGYNSGGYYLAPAFDILLTASDLGLKNKILRGDLAYKITAGPDGTRLLHLMNVPGAKLGFGGNDSQNGSLGLVGSKVWYHYYETSSENLDKCRELNKDIVKMPNEVPLDELDYSDLNSPTKTLVRQLFFAYAKMSLANVMGRFGGVIGVEGAERTMNFESYANDGKEERKEVLARLEERLIRLSSEKQLERAANEAENLNKTLQYQPLGIYMK